MSTTFLDILTSVSMSRNAQAVLTSLLERHPPSLHDELLDTLTVETKATVKPHPLMCLEPEAICLASVQLLSLEVERHYATTTEPCKRRPILSQNAVQGQVSWKRILVLMDQRKLTHNAVSPEAGQHPKHPEGR